MTILNKIKELFSEVEVPTVEVEFVDVKTEDGRIYRVSAIEVDGTIVEITEDGEVPVEDGDIVIANEEAQTKLSIAGGIITAVEELEVEEEEKEEDVVTEEPAEIKEELSEAEIKELSEIKALIESLFTKVSTLELANESLKLELSKINEQDGDVVTVTKLDFSSNSTKELSYVQRYVKNKNK
jgi:hypothetical protein